MKVLQGRFWTVAYLCEVFSSKIAVESLQKIVSVSAQWDVQPGFFLFFFQIVLIHKKGVFFFLVIYG